MLADEPLSSHSLVCSLVRSCVCSFICSFVRVFVRLFDHKASEGPAGTNRLKTAISVVFFSEQWCLSNIAEQASSLHCLSCKTQLAAAHTGSLMRSVAHYSSLSPATAA